MMFDEVVLACGTAFYYKCSDQTFLVSNWHNFSGRNPETHKPLRDDAAIPNRLKVYDRQESDLASLSISTHKLEYEGKPIWYEHPSLGSRIDIGVIPIEKSRYDILSAINAIDPHEKWGVEVGEQVFVLGFPYGITASHHLPVWKAGTLASEPQIDIDELPQMLIDTATRAGMSGSPVIQYLRRPVSLMEKGGKMVRYRAALIGIYSGRIVPKDKMDAQLGKVWKAACIKEVIKGRKTAKL